MSHVISRELGLGQLFHVDEAVELPVRSSKFRPKPSSVQIRVSSFRKQLRHVQTPNSVDIKYSLGFGATFTLPDPNSSKVCSSAFPSVPLSLVSLMFLLHVTSD